MFKFWNPKLFSKVVVPYYVPICDTCEFYVLQIHMDHHHLVWSVFPISTILIDT